MGTRHIVRSGIEVAIHPVVKRFEMTGENATVVPLSKYSMNRDERRLITLFALLLGALLVLTGVVLREWVARTLAAEEKVNLAFLDHSLRDRSRYPGDLLSEHIERKEGWPGNLADLLTRNHAD